MDHDLSPPWTLLNITKAIKSGFFTQPPAQCKIEKNIAHQIQSWVPDAPAGAQLVFIPTA